MIKIGSSIEQLLEETKEWIRGASQSGLWVDSELIIMNPKTNEVKIYKVEYTDDYGMEMTFTEVTKGRAFHVGIAGRFGDRPTEEKPFVATVHVHS